MAGTCSLHSVVLRARVEGANTQSAVRVMECRSASKATPTPNHTVQVLWGSTSSSTAKPLNEKFTVCQSTRHVPRCPIPLAPKRTIVSRTACKFRYFCLFASAGADTRDALDTDNVVPRVCRTGTTLTCSSTSSTSQWHCESTGFFHCS